MKFFTLIASIFLSLNTFASDSLMSFLESGKLSEISGDFKEAEMWYERAIEFDSASY